MAGDEQVLNNGELLAIILGSGLPGEISVGLAYRILASVSGNLNKMALLSIEKLIRFRGMGVAKSCSGSQE